MFPLASTSLLASATAMSVLDTQTVTTGTNGTAVEQDRVRGWDETSVVGSISDGTSGIYSGAAITGLYWSENGGAALYELVIPSATNSGWTTLTIGSKVLLRASAVFSAGVWTWTTTDTVANQALGGAGSTRSCVFT